MGFFREGLKGAWELIRHHDPYLVHLVRITLEVAGVSTGLALLIGLPIGLFLGLARFRGRGVLLVVSNAGLGLPPVVVGLVLILLLLPIGPLGHLNLAFTLRGVFIAQTILCLPIITALTSAAVREISPGLLDQARAFGAGRLGVALLALREARIGILAATIASVGAGLSEVGAVVLVGGNIQGYDETLASAALANADAGHYADGLAIAIILLAMILLVTGLLTWLQYGRSTFIRSPS